MTPTPLRDAHTVVTDHPTLGSVTLLDLRTGPRLPVPPLARADQHRYDTWLDEVGGFAYVISHAASATPAVADVVLVLAGHDLPPAGLIATIRTTMPDGEAAPAPGTKMSHDLVSNAEWALRRTVPDLSCHAGSSEQDDPEPIRRRTVLQTVLGDPDGYFTCRDQPPPTPGTRETVRALTEMVGWADSGVAHHWQARAWQRRQVRSGKHLSDWRLCRFADAEIATHAPYCAIPDAAATYREHLPPQHWQRWWSQGGALIGPLVAALHAAGMAPADAGLLAAAYTTRGSCVANRAYGNEDILPSTDLPSTHGMVALAALPDLPATAAAIALRAGLNPAEIITAHQGGRLDGPTVASLRTMAALAGAG